MRLAENTRVIPSLLLEQQHVSCTLRDSGMTSFRLSAHKRSKNVAKAITEHTPMGTMTGPPEIKKSINIGIEKPPLRHTMEPNTRKRLGKRPLTMAKMKPSSNT